MADERRWKKEDRGHRADLLKTSSLVGLEGRNVKSQFKNNIYILFGSRL